MQRGGVLPREWRDRKNCPLREQEYCDANKLKHWKQAVRYDDDSRPAHQQSEASNEKLTL